MESTPLAKAIEEIKSFKESLNDPKKVESFEISLDVLKNLLPAEREMVEKSFTEGNRQEFYDGSETICKDYFDANYSQIK